MIAAELESPLSTPARRRRRSPSRPGAPEDESEAGMLRRLHQRIDWLPYWLLLPSIALTIALLGYPIVRLVETSFQKYGLFELINHKTTWIGAQNYTSIFSSSSFWQAVLRTVLFTAACVGGTMVLGTVVALALKRLGRTMRTVVSVVMVLAWAMPPVSAAIVWQWLFANEFGVVDWILTELHLGNLTNFDWTGRSPLIAFCVITMMIVWQAIPFVALSLYAGLVQIPSELYESARVDGAGGFSIWRSVTLPLLAPIFGLLTILSIIWDFNVFTQIYVLTQGGPNNGT